MSLCTMMFVAGQRMYHADLIGGLHDGERVSVTLPPAMSGPAAGRVTFRGMTYRLWKYKGTMHRIDVFLYVHEDYDLDCLYADEPAEDDQQHDAD